MALSDTIWKIEKISIISLSLFIGSHDKEAKDPLPHIN